MVNKNKRIIWTNNDYDEWRKCMIADMEDGESEDDFTYERYYDDCDIFLYDEKANLNIKVDGYIVAFADLGLWDGRHNGAKVIGTNVKDILSSGCDFITWYCDRYNVRCEGIHHDGTNYILYRVAKDYDHAKRLVQRIVCEDMTEQEFRKATRSLRKYVAEQYGW